MYQEKEYYKERYRNIMYNILEQLNPEHRTYELSKLSLIYFKLKCFSEILEQLLDRGEVNPYYFEGSKLNWTYFNLEHFSGAIETYKKTKTIDLIDYELLNNLPVEANNVIIVDPNNIELCKQAILIMPFDAEAHYNLGVSYCDCRDYTEAIKSFQQAIKIKNDYAEVLNNMGVSFYELNRYDEAIKSFQKAINIIPNYKKAYKNLGISYYENEQYDKAIETFKYLLNIDDDVVSRFYLSLSFYLTGNSGSYYYAIKEYKIVRKFDPELSSLLFDLFMFELK